MRKFSKTFKHQQLAVVRFLLLLLNQHDNDDDDDNDDERKKRFEKLFKLENSSRKLQFPLIGNQTEPFTKWNCPPRLESKTHNSTLATFELLLLDLMNREKTAFHPHLSCPIVESSDQYHWNRHWRRPSCHVRLKATSGAVQHTSCSLPPPDWDSSSHRIDYQSDSESPSYAGRDESRKRRPCSPETAADMHYLPSCHWYTRWGLAVENWNPMYNSLLRMRLVGWL